MIYLIYGSDKETARAKERALVESLIVKKPDASVGRYNADTFQVGLLDELIGGQGLFVARLIVELDRLFVNEEFQELVLENLERLAASENIFIILEEKLLKPELKKFEKYAEKIQAYDLKKDESGGQGNGWGKKGDVSPFALADALGRRDKKQLWALYVGQRKAGSVPEELHGLLFWQIKSILLAGQAASAEAAGLKPFVYGKAKQFAGNFSAEEIKTLSKNMVSIYHDAHRGMGDLDLLLERLILEL